MGGGGGLGGGGLKKIRKVVKSSTGENFAACDQQFHDEFRCQ